MNCLLDGRDVFAVIPTGFGESKLISAVLHRDRTEDLGRVCEQCDFF